MLGSFKVYLFLNFRPYNSCANELASGGGTSYDEMVYNNGLSEASLEGDNVITQAYQISDGNRIFRLSSSNGQYSRQHATGMVYI